MKKRKKYLVIGDYIISENDGQVHFVSARQLCELYGLNPHAPNVRLADIRRPETFWGYDDSWIRLYPKYDGKYSKILEDKDD